jgi:hypothetical protein
MLTLLKRFNAWVEKREDYVIDRNGNPNVRWHKLILGFLVYSGIPAALILGALYLTLS